MSAVQCPIAALVLAAGESKRMPGKNKLLLPFAGKTIIECTVDAILPAAIAEVIVVLGHEAELLRKVLGKRPVKFIHNPNYRSGMASSIQTGLAAISPSAKALLIALGDQPLLQPDELNRLISAFSQTPNHTIAVPICKGQRGHPVIFDRRYSGEIFALTGDIGCKSILARHPAAVLEVEMPASHILEDADTPEAYARLIAHARKFSTKF
ncbi:MAG: Nicotine blue oxidoreductase [bacterium]|nr:Nicotine blue oxidoreductase [bacterium]